MLKIGILNCKPNLKNALENLSTIEVISLDNRSDFPELDGLYINWVSSEEDFDKYKRTGAFLDQYITKKTKIIIFDSKFSLQENEIEWLIKYRNVYLYEPRIITRFGFSYMPFCCNIPSEIPLFDEEKKRPIDLGYKDYSLNGKIKYFDYYYKNYKEFSDNTVYYDANLQPEKEKEYKEIGLIKEPFDYSNCKCSLCLGTNEEYYTGYLSEEIFNIIEFGCLPLLPIEHIYFHALFNELIIKDLKNLDWHVKLFDGINYGLRVDFYDRIQKYFPLFDCKNLANYIISIIKE